VEKLRAEGYRILAIEQIENSTMLNDFRAEEGVKYALVFGNEVEGVDQTIADVVDGAIEIPQVGIKHSLNVSVSAGILMWEMFRQSGK
jgi:tRNA G18 (ribose-2'-O)-methylase SpoU